MTFAGIGSEIRAAVGIALGLVLGALVTSSPASLAPVDAGRGRLDVASAARTDSKAEQSVLRDGTDRAEDLGEPNVMAVRAVADETQRVAPAARAHSRSEVVAIIVAAADEFGVDEGLMLRLAHCESTLRPNAVNPKSGAAGLYQFLTAAIFENNARRIGLTGDQRLDPEASARVAASKISREGTWAWEQDPRSVACWDGQRRSTPTPSVRSP